MDLESIGNLLKELQVFAKKKLKHIKINRKDVICSKCFQSVQGAEIVVKIIIKKLWFIPLVRITLVIETAYHPACGRVTVTVGKAKNMEDVAELLRFFIEQSMKAEAEKIEIAKGRSRKEITIC